MVRGQPERKGGGQASEWTSELRPLPFQGLIMYGNVGVRPEPATPAH
jgi:hypothetical protein